MSRNLAVRLSSTILFLLFSGMGHTAEVVLDNKSTDKLLNWLPQVFSGDNAIDWSMIINQDITVTDMTDSTANGGWAYSTLTRFFSSGELLDDFEARFNFAYDSLNSSGIEDVKAMQSIDIWLVDSSGNPVISVGMTDAWVGAWGNLYSTIEGNTVDTGGANTAPSNVSTDVTIARSANRAAIITSAGIAQTNQSSSTPIAGVKIRFGHYKHTASGPSFFGREWVDLVRVSKEPTIRVSTSSAGTEGNGHSVTPTISANGRYVAFESLANKLVANDNNSTWDIFIRDTLNNTTTRISTDSVGAEGNNSSRNPVLSADGRYVAFESPANNLVANDNNSTWDIFIRDTLNNTTTRISTDSAGTEGNSGSLEPALSADGRYVAFESLANNLVANDNNGYNDIFIRDTLNNITTRISTDSAGTAGNNHSFDPTISANGRYVAFESPANNLVANDNNNASDVFIRDTLNNTTTRLSTDSEGAEGNNSSRNPVLSANGRYVAFESYANNLVANDNNGTWDIFIRDTLNNTTTRISTDSEGIEVNDHSLEPALSADGRYVAFYSGANNLVANDNNGIWDIFIRDTLNNTTTRISTDSAGTEGNSGSLNPALSADGRYVAFYSSANNLVANDNNNASDVFRAENADFSPDTDGDGLRDDNEAMLGTDPSLTDTDGDGLTDYEETNTDLTPYVYTPDSDTDPNDPDTDGDGFTDGQEVLTGTDPLDIFSYPSNGDLNGDGLVNAADIIIGQRILAGLIVSTSGQLVHGDVAPLSGGMPVPDGVFTTGDLLVIQQKALGLVNF